MNAILRAVGDWGFLLFAVGLFVLGSSFLGFTRWRTTPGGKGIGAFFICSNAIIILSFLRLFGLLGPDSGWYWAIRAAVFLGGGLAVLVVAASFVRFQFIRRRSGEAQKAEVRLD